MTTLPRTLPLCPVRPRFMLRVTKNTFSLNTNTRAAGYNGWGGPLCAALVEACQKVLLGRQGVDVGEVAHDVGLLLPDVAGLVKLHRALGQQHVDNADVLHVRVLGELFPDLVPHLVHRNVQQIRARDLGRLRGGEEGGGLGENKGTRMGA